MRNLKKILALVLALVMSLSLMATASAADFADADKINETFDPAVEVLSGLGVFNGYKEDGTFRPQGSITRAETAAIIYRIVTGDVEDKQVGIYADYNIFDDVPSTAWYAGYVNFCANAEYIKGRTDGTFNPQGQVTGYAALAMILRAIGYTANGGFTGSDWEVQTARTAEARKITKNIMTGTLGQPATRESVAEILYQAIMVNMVDHNVDNTFNGDQGYFEKSNTLGQQTFGLEKIEAVILANEWANLEGDTVLAEGKTTIEITGISTGNAKTVSTVKVGDKPTVDAVAEDDMQGALDAVGLTYDAHIATKLGDKVVSLSKSDKNVVAYNEGKGVYEATKDNRYLNNATWASVAKLAEKDGIRLGSTVVGAENETEYFVNYEQWWDIDYKSDIIIRYVLEEEGLNEAVRLGYISSGTKADYIAYLNDLANITTPGKYSPQTVTVTGKDADGNLATGAAATQERIWTRTIQPGKLIVAEDRAIMKSIFWTANLLGTYELGEVYAGTAQEIDQSDTKSWEAFQKEFFNIDENSKTFSTCEIGNSLRVVDNDADGYAEYVLRIDYTQDKVVGTVKDLPAGYSVALSGAKFLYNPQADELTMGTVFNYTTLDKKLYVWPAPVVSNETITNKNFQNITVTASNGETYNQSGIVNETKLDENIMLMNQNTRYNMYMDVYGVNIRSYELAQGGKYALLTEMYPTGNMNSNYVQNWQAVAEVKIQEADVKEYPVTGSLATLNLFYSPSIWTWGARTYYGVDANVSAGVRPDAALYNANYLQPAVAHLGINTAANNVPLGANAVWTGSTTNTVAEAQTTGTGSWWRYVAQANDTNTPLKGTGSEYGVFNYGTVTVNEEPNATFSFTNVATYIDNDGTLTLSSASKLAKDREYGAQLYRVSTAAAAAVPSFVAGAAQADKDMVSLWGIGTATQLVAAYDRATGTNGGQTWFNTYIGLNAAGTAATGLYRDGTGIYPVYAEDYVQLDLTKRDDGLAPIGDIAVKAGTRHYHIDDNYSANYNTNGNKYVDATVETEFYIVLPGNETSIQYYKGFANLPTIETNKIRAAYAVAHNTAEQSNGQDYWVADVVVIELSELTYNYDSISLVFYNPYEQNDYVRYADTLNNEWKTLQPDFDGLAKMGITPKAGFNSINWGNVSWSWGNTANYGFWKLFRTELTAPGQLAVTSAEKILTGEYNGYGIYAGTAIRIEDLQTSNYVDVSAVNTGSGFTHLIDVDYNEATEVPFYRIDTGNAAYGTIYSATLLNDNQALRWSDVKNGDRLIWVYEKTNPSRIAFVVDLDSREDNYATPGWLRDLYTDIAGNGAPAPVADATVTAEFYTNIEDPATKVADAGITVTPKTIKAADLNKLNEVKYVEAGAYTIDTGVDPEATGAQLVADAAGKLYLTAVTGNVVIKFEVNQDADYNVKVADGTDPVSAAIADGYAATALTNKVGGATIAKAGEDVAYGTTVVATVTRANATTGYTATKTVGGVTTALTPVSANGTTIVYEVEVTADTVITVTKAADAVGNTAVITALAFTIGDDENTVNNNDDLTIANIPAGTTSTVMTPTLTGTGAYLKVWRGLPAAKQEVTAVDGKYTLTVGAAGAAVVYTIEAYAQNGAKTETVTVNLAAAALSPNINITNSTAGTGLVTVVHTAAQAGPPAVAAVYTATIVAGQGTSTNVGMLLSWLTYDTTPVASIIVVADGTSTTALPNDTPVAETQKVLVTAANGDTQYYDIIFA